MYTLILDIETVGEEWGTIDEVTQAQLLSWVCKTAGSEAEYASRVDDLKQSLGFSPFTGKVVALGVYDQTRKQGTVYYESTQGEDDRVGSFFYRPRSEAMMLAEFWEGVTQYDTVVTYNGRAFDIPFILHRSVVHGVMPTVDLMRYRYLTQQVPPYHIDLADQLSFYGAMGKRPSLHLLCRAYGIESPKSHGVTGHEVAALYQAGRIHDIATYNTHDLLATALLYEKWCTYLAPSLFRQQAEEFDI